jgi:hypothetical protein
MGELDDRPRESTDVDVTLVARGVTLTAYVRESRPDSLVLEPALDTAPSGTTVKNGDRLEVFWMREDEERMVPAALSEVVAGSTPRWQVSVTGASERSQRRRTVRARVELPVRIPWAGGAMVGNTQDLSEAGTLVLVDGWGIPPEPGDPLTVSIELEDGALEVRGEAVRQQLRAVQWLVAIRFTNPAERIQDRLRQRVFQALREERAQANR